MNHLPVTIKHPLRAQRAAQPATPLAQRLAAAHVTLFATALTLAPLAAIAAPPLPPDSGDLLQQVKPVTPAAPASNSTGLTVQRPGGGSEAAGTAFPVSGFAITGNTLFDTPTLLALVAGSNGQSFNVVQLGQLAGRITEYYHAHGYPLARAIVPAQSIKDGIVTFQGNQQRRRLLVQLRDRTQPHRQRRKQLFPGVVPGRSELDHHSGHPHGERHQRCQQNL
jgi:hemolysin activation/secretion protein